MKTRKCLWVLRWWKRFQKRPVWLDYFERGYTSRNLPSRLALQKKSAQKEVLKHVFQTAKLTKQGLFRLLYSNIWHDTNGIYYCGTVGTIWKIPSKNFWHSLPWRPFGEKWQFFTIHGSQAFNNKNAILMFEMSNVQLQWQLFKYQRLLWSILFSYP